MEEPTKLTWEQKKNDYMREYMRKRYNEKRDEVLQQQRIRQRAYRARLKEKGTNDEKKIEKLQEKNAKKIEKLQEKIEKLKTQNI